MELHRGPWRREPGRREITAALHGARHGLDVIAELDAGRLARSFRRIIIVRLDVHIVRGGAGAGVAVMTMACTMQRQIARVRHAGTEGEYPHQQQESCHSADIGSAVQHSKDQRAMSAAPWCGMQCVAALIEINSPSQCARAALAALVADRVVRRMLSGGNLRHARLSVDELSADRLSKSVFEHSISLTTSKPQTSSLDATSSASLPGFLSLLLPS